MKITVKLSSTFWYLSHSFYKVLFTNSLTVLLFYRCKFCIFPSYDMYHTVILYFQKILLFNYPRIIPAPRGNSPFILTSLRVFTARYIHFSHDYIVQSHLFSFAITRRIFIKYFPLLTNMLKFRRYFTIYTFYFFTILIHIFSFE